MSDTTETSTYHLSVTVTDNVSGGMWGSEIDLDLPITDEGALSLAAAFAGVLPPAPATQIRITRYDRTTIQSYGDLAGGTFV